MKIRYQNNQLWYECQLVSIWNACRYWGLDYPIMGTREYKLACAEACAISGAAIGVASQFRKYGIVRIYGGYNFIWVKCNLPVEFGVFCHHGCHSVLAVAVRSKKVLLANYARDRTYWMDWDRLCKISNKRWKPVQFKAK